MSVFLLKDAFKSIVDDPGYIALFLLSIIVYIIALICIFFTVSDIFSIGQRIQDQSYIISMFQEKMLILLAIVIIYGIIGIIFYAIAMAGLIKKVDL